jgi:electron transfer flavoprotein alpha subunit
MDQAIWIWLEHDGGEITEASLEVLCEARKIGNNFKEKVIAVLLGGNTASLAPEAIAYGADTVYCLQDTRYNQFNTELYVEVFAGLAETLAPHLVLISSTANGAGLAPRMAAHLGWGYAANTVKIALQDDRSLLIQVEKFLAKANGVYTFAPQQTVVATMKPGSLGLDRANRKRQGETIIFEQEQTASVKTEVCGFVKADPKVVALSEAERIVAGGNGFKEQADLDLLWRLAEAVEAAVGGSKPVVDRGWIPYNRLVGQSSGRRLAPKLFITAGVSGSSHFVEGMKGSRLIISINTEKGAPLMKEADLAIVGDLYEILPEVTKQLNARREGAEK